MKGSIKMKKFRRSPVAIVCYAIAALVFVYFAAVVVSTIISINQYYSSYGMSPGFGETLGYILQNGLTQLVSAITIFMAGFILEEVRKLNPANWKTDEEIAEEREARMMEKEAKIIAKGEEAKAKAEAAAEKAEALEDKFDEKLEAAKAEFSAVVAETEEDKTVAEAALEETKSGLDQLGEEIDAAAEEFVEEVKEAAEKLADKVDAE